MARLSCYSMLEPEDAEPGDAWPRLQVAHIGTYALPETGGRAAHIAGYALAVSEPLGASEMFSAQNRRSEMATAEAETSQDERWESGGVVYDGFISYSHAADDLLAPRLQAGLQRFAKPWGKRRALRIFRDESSLSANPHLWSSITDALDQPASHPRPTCSTVASTSWAGCSSPTSVTRSATRRSSPCSGPTPQSSPTATPPQRTSSPSPRISQARTSKNSSGSVSSDRSDARAWDYGFPASTQSAMS